MKRIGVVLRCIVAASLVAAAPGPIIAQEPAEGFKNLKVLPQETSPEDLHAIMRSYSRALGVRCIHCHVGEEGKPIREEDFQKDDKPTKIKAREMMLMTKDLNDKYLANLAHRSDPPVSVQCLTCHHGVTQPRPLQDLLSTAYEKGGMDSTLAAYGALRERYYGSFAYDFGDMPLADVAWTLRESGHAADAESLLALDVEMNPKSSSAKRQHATAVLMSGFEKNADAGSAAYREFRERYGDKLVNEGFVNNVAYDLLEQGKEKASLAAFAFNIAENPKSANAYDSMGEAYFKTGDRKKATAAYKKSLELDPANDNATRMLEELKSKPKGTAKGK